MGLKNCCISRQSGSIDAQLIHSNQDGAQATASPAYQQPIKFEQVIINNKCTSTLEYCSIFYNQ